MIIGYLYIVRITFLPFKTNPPLLVDTYGILSFSISSQGVKIIAWVKHQRFETWSSMKNHKSFSCLSFERLKPSNAFIIKKSFSISTGK